MNKVMTSIFGLALVFIASNAWAQQPSKDDIVKAKATYTGTLKQANGKRIGPVLPPSKATEKFSSSGPPVK